MFQLFFSILVVCFFSNRWKLGHYWSCTACGWSFSLRVQRVFIPRNRNAKCGMDKKELGQDKRKLFMCTPHTLVLSLDLGGPQSPFFSWIFLSVWQIFFICLTESKRDKRKLDIVVYTEGSETTRGGGLGLVRPWGQNKTSFELNK